MTLSVSIHNPIRLEAGCTKAQGTAWIDLEDGNGEQITVFGPYGDSTWLEDFAEAVRLAVASPGETINIVDA